MKDTLLYVQIFVVIAIAFVVLSWGAKVATPAAAPPYCGSVVEREGYSYRVICTPTPTPALGMR